MKTAALGLVVLGILASAPGVLASGPTPGHTYRIAFNPQLTTHVPVDAVPSGPPLLFSDRPESVTRPALLAEGHLAGHFRLMYYELNTATIPMYFAAVLSNPGRRPVTVRVRHAGFGAAGPGEYNLAGQTQEYGFFHTTRTWTIRVPAHSMAFLDPRVLKQPTKFGTLDTALYDLISSGPVTAMVVALAKPSLGEVGTLKPLRLPHGVGAGLGTFLRSDRTVTVSDHGQLETFWLASGQGQDPYGIGYDALHRNRAVDVGNYGFLYHVRIDYTATRSGPVRVVITSASQHQAQEDVLLSAVVDTTGTAAGALKVPADNGYSVTNPHHAVYIEGATLRSGQHHEFSFWFLPAAGCDAIANVSILPPGEGLGPL